MIHSLIYHVTSLVQSIYNHNKVCVIYSYAHKLNNYSKQLKYDIIHKFHHKFIQSPQFSYGKFILHIVVYRMNFLIM